MGGWPELSSRFLNTAPARLFGSDSENRSHGFQSSFRLDVNRGPSYIMPCTRGSKKDNTQGIKV